MRTLTSTILATLVLGAGLGALPSSAHAQEGGGAPSSSSSSSGLGIGVGATRTLAGVSAATVVYDKPSFHIVGLLGFVNQNRDPQDDVTLLVIGGQFLYHLHTTSQSDFSVGGGLSVVTYDLGPGDSATNVDLEGLAQIRVFLASNVALSASLGLLIAVGDDNAGTFTEGGGAIFETDAENTIAIGGQVTGSFGLTYFFP